MPLPLLGLLTYGAVAALAATAGGAATASWTDAQRNNADLALLGGATLLASCSAVLVYLLNTALGGEVCAWCYASAGLSTAIFASVAAGLSRGQWSQGAAPSAGVLAASVAALYFGFGGLGSSSASVEELPYDVRTEGWRGRGGGAGRRLTRGEDSDDEKEEVGGKAGGGVRTRARRDEGGGGG